MKHKKKSSETVGTISGSELLKHSAGKLGKHDDLVRAGSGAHKDKKKYNRKAKESQQLKVSLKEYKE